MFIVKKILSPKEDKRLLLELSCFLRSSIINTIRFYHNYYVIFKKINDINGLITLAFSLAKQIQIEKLSKNELINLLSKLFK